MPHITIEYTQDALNEEMATHLVDIAFLTVHQTKLFRPQNIKIRLIPIQYYRTGLDIPGFIHIHCHIHPGKTEQQKQKLTNNLVDAIQSAFTVAVITAEVSETDKATYTKRENKS